MPNVIIKGMEEMPPRCRECFAVQLWDEMDYCKIAERWQPWDAVTRPDWCPLHPAPEWISVEERLPEKRKWVLCLCRTGSQDVLWRQNDGWYHDHYHQYMSEFVTHWMPLPEPPKEETT